LEWNLCDRHALGSAVIALSLNSNRNFVRDEIPPQRCIRRRALQPKLLLFSHLSGDRAHGKVARSLGV